MAQRYGAWIVSQVGAAYRRMWPRGQPCMLSEEPCTECVPSWSLGVRPGRDLNRHVINAAARLQCDVVIATVASYNASTKSFELVIQSKHWRGKIQFNFTKIGKNQRRHAAVQ